MSDGTNQNFVVYKDGTHEFMHGLPVDNGDILAVFPCTASLKPLPKNYFDEEENMKNANMPAMPITDYQLASALKIGAIGASGMTKREVIAKDIAINEYKFKSLKDMGDFIGRDIDHNSTEDVLRATAECDAKVRTMYADALLKELEK